MVFHAEALALDDDGFCVVEEAIEDGGGNAAVVIEDGGPGFVRLVSRDDGGAAFVTLADDLEEQVGAGLVERKIVQNELSHLGCWCYHR